VAAALSPHRIDLVHAIPGRVRLRWPALRWDASLAERVLVAGMAHPGVRSVRINRACGALVVEGDPAVLETSTALVRRWGDAQRPVPTMASPISAQEPLTRPRWQQIASLALPVAGLALSFIATGPALIATALGAIPIARRAFSALVDDRRLSADQLDASAVVLMLALGDVRAAAFMTALVALGEEIRERTARRSRRATMDLQEALGKSASLVRGTEKVKVPVDQLRRGDVVAIYTGDLIPVDGVVLEGSAMVDQKILTGESRLIDRTVGEEVLAATVVADGKLYVRAEAVGKTTRAGLVVQALAEATMHDTRASSWANRFADRLVGPTFVLAGAAFLTSGNLARAASILIVDFATGIRVSAPTAVLATMTRAAREGVLIKGGRAIEQLAAVDAIVFDKTGTLTKGKPKVSDVLSLHEAYAPEVLLGLAAAAELRLKHPSARALVRHARKCKIAIPRREDSEYTTGQGVRATVEGREVRVGSARFLANAGIEVRRAAVQVSRLSERGHSFVYLAIDGELSGLVSYYDPPRPQASKLVCWLKENGVSDILMVTGDEVAAAEPVAQALGITQLHAAALPDEKARIVADLQARGRTVAVVGDGINDSPALAMADVSISLSSGADVARQTADVVLMQPKNLMNLALMMQLSRQCMGLIHQNFGIVAGPNAGALALATVGAINPVLATVVNNGSTIVAGLNSLRPLLTDGRRHAAGAVA
jgi:P-type Cu2+ transporter